MLTQQPSAALLLWSRRMQRFERSDLTVAAFCQSEGVSQASYYYWRRKLRAETNGHSNDSPTTPVKFLPVSFATDDSCRAPRLDAQTGVPAVEQPVASMTVDLPGGISIRLELPVGEGHAP
jgi:transposase-like protein